MNELHYVTYDPEAIWNEMMTVYQDTGGEILYPGDEKEILLRAVQAIVVQAFAGVDNGIRMNTLRYAQGEYLDVIGENRNCPRILAAPASCLLTITFNATGIAKVFPAGTLVSHAGLVFYLMSEAAHIGNETSVDVYARCTVPGTQGNGLRAGSKLYPVIADPAINQVVAKTTATGGVNDEEDEEYRERIRVHMTESVTTGTKRSYESVVRKVSPDIIDARAMRRVIGGVSVLVLFRDGLSVEDQTALKNTIKGVLDNRDVRPLGDTVDVELVSDVSYVLNLTYTVEEGQNIQGKVVQAVEDYKKWQQNTIGREYNPYRLVSALYVAGAKKVDFAPGTLFDGQQTGNQYHEIEPTQRCKGTVLVSLG